MDQKADHNPYLKPWRQPQPNFTAGKGTIEKPGEFPNIIWQTRSAPPSEYENQLGDALEKAFSAGAETLEQVVAQLNEQGMLTSDGNTWTHETFAAEMSRLAAK
jgi:hypothetical protein